MATSMQRELLQLHVAEAAHSMVQVQQETGPIEPAGDFVQEINGEGELASPSEEPIEPVKENGQGELTSPVTASGEPIEPGADSVHEINGEGNSTETQVRVHIEAPDGSLPLDSVVKLFCKHTKPNFSLPWQKHRQHSSTSSGFVISGRRLLTTGHSVQHHTQVKVKKRSSDTKFLATVLAVGVECDLALLTVDNDKFWEGLVSPIVFGDLPSLQDAVTVVGYPVGGDCMSVTRGVVSRVEVTSYVDGSRLLGVQIDAAINAGNSGGPAFNDKAQSVGIAFRKFKGCDNIGYIIPTPVITHFITDYELNGEYTGFPTLGISWQRLENPDLRNSLCIAPHLKGILIRKVEPTSPAAEFLQPSDILLSFDGVDVANDATVPFRNGERIRYSYLVSAKYTGEQASIKILRDSVMKSFDIRLHAHKPLVPKHTEPSYYITGGIVFTSVSEPYLSSEFGKDFRHSAPPFLIKKYLHSTARTKDDELVIVSQILAADINVDYEDYSNRLVISFNGTLIKNLKQLVHLVETCKEPYLRFGLQDKYMLVLDTRRAQEATPKILKTHCIPSAMSQDLKAMCEAQN